MSTTWTRRGSGAHTAGRARVCPAPALAAAGLVVGALLSALPQRASAQSGAESEIELPKLKVVDPRYIDRSADACSDFFQYANGAWLAADTIPADYSESGVEREMSDRNELVVRGVLEDAVARAPSLPQGSTERKLGTFYGTCMDSATAEAAGAAPIRPVLARIDAIGTRAALVARIAALQEAGANVAFRYRAEVNPHDAAHYIAGFDQGGLGLPDRDYYTKTDSASRALRAAYVEHIARLLTLAGEGDAAARADAARVLSLETELARVSLRRVQRREPAATDHPMPLDSLEALAPSIDWAAYLRSADVSVPVRRVNVGVPAFFRRLGALVRTRPLADWKAYLRYHAVSEAAPWLSTPFAEESFRFASRFTGAKRMLPRWKRCLQVTDNLMGEALGKAYVEKTFSPEAKAKATSVIHDIEKSFGERLRRLDWMSDSTRAQALKKLARVHEKIGYPSHWRDYSALRVADGPFVVNVDNAVRFEWRRTAGRPGQPVDTTEWDMTVPTVNAYYDPSMNEIVFPAGALQPQTFDVGADDGANYGSLGGSWAGHELTHGFDDEGRHYDAEGNLRDWWTPADSAHFTREANLMVKQFDGYIQVDTIHVNGRLTLGENIADYGGLLTAYDALEHALARDGRPGPIDGFTPEQRFFLGYAQSWRVHNRPERLRNRVLVDPHAPERWRVDGPLSDMPAFARAFGCKPGDRMVRPDSLVPHIW